MISDSPAFIGRQQALCEQYRVELRAFQARAAALPGPDELTDAELIAGASRPASRPSHIRVDNWLRMCLDKMEAIDYELAVLNQVRVFELEARDLEENSTD